MRFLRRIAPLNAGWILRESIRLNGLYDGGWVCIKAHPICGYGVWVVEIDHLAGEPTKRIASGPDLRTVVTQAELELTYMRTHP